MKILELSEFPIDFKFEIINSRRMAGIFVSFQLRVNSYIGRTIIFWDYVAKFSTKSNALILNS